MQETIINTGSLPNNPTTTKATARIEWIDAIRGFTMVLVVYSHISCYLVGNDHELLNSYFIQFRMPLFFFISGFFVWSPQYTKEKLLSRAQNRIKLQLYPTLIIATIYFFTLFDGTLNNMIFNVAKGGYWFTIVAVEMFLLIAPILCIMHTNNRGKTHQSLILIFIATLYAISVPIINYILGHSIFQYKIASLTSFEFLQKYIVYFILGIVFRINENSLLNIITNRFTFLISLILFFTVQHFIGYWRIYTFIQAISGICIVFYTFNLISKSEVISNSRFSDKLKKIGRLTLEIYLLHYFVIFSLRKFSAIQYLHNLADTPYEPVIALVLAVIVTYTSIAIATILKKIKVYKLIFAKD